MAGKSFAVRWGNATVSPRAVGSRFHNRHARQTGPHGRVFKPANPDFTNAPGHGDDDARFYDRQQAYVHARGG